MEDSKTLKKSETMKTKTSVILILFLLMGTTMGLTHVPQTHIDIKVLNSQNPSVSLLPTLKTTVGGYTCSDEPEVSGACYPNGVGCEIPCPSTNAGGCAIVVFGSAYNRIEEVDVYPGQIVELSDLGNEPWLYWENYYCDSSCSCTNWVVEGCGIKGCSANERYKSRTCNAGCTLITQVCLADIAYCGSETCYDSDGGHTYNEKGYVQTAGKTYYDNCKGTTTLNEYVCSAVSSSGGDFSKVDIHTCGTTEECVDGRCVSNGSGGGDGNMTCEQECEFNLTFQIKEFDGIPFLEQVTTINQNAGINPLCFFGCKMNEFFTGVFKFTIAVVKMIASIVIGLAVMLASKSMLYNKKKGKKNNNLSATIIAIILGLVIGFGVWMIL